MHFTEAYQGVCDIPPERLKVLYREINDYFYRMNASGGPPRARGAADLS